MTSPIIKNQFNFKTALDKILEGKKITKLEWKNKDYGFMKSEILHINRDGRDNQWILSEGDLTGEDFVVVD